MALIVEFICELPNGVHARPASHVVIRLEINDRE